jgi:hypothetical protein
MSIFGKLREFRQAEKLENLPGIDTADEKTRLSKVLNGILDHLLDGVEVHPTKLWVMTEFQIALKQVEGEETEGREHFGMELEYTMDILGIESSDGLLAAYLGGL